MYGTVAPKNGLGAQFDPETAPSVGGAGKSLTYKVRAPPKLGTFSPNLGHLVTPECGGIRYETSIGVSRVLNASAFR